jgi:steroid 5-alpha reductase family enzyme
MIDHFDLLGTRQVWLFLQGKEYDPPAFRIVGLYKWVRHPLYIGWALAFWVTPTMTLGHLFFASSLSAYMVLASKFEERDLVRAHGRQYEDYQRRVRAFTPRLGNRQTEAAPVSADSV